MSEGHALSTFRSLGLTPRLLSTLDELGYKSPTPIQQASIPSVREGRDILGCAQTGTGKTAAFLLPLIERLSGGKGRRKKGAAKRPRALILAPTRELAGQITESFQTYARSMGLRYTAIYGGVKQFRQVRDLQSGVDLIVATPGRMIDLMEQGHIDLSEIEMFVLDEADCMLDMGFVDPIRRISRHIPPQRQTLLFSATMPPKIRTLADTLLRDPVHVSVTPVASTAPLIEQTVYRVPTAHKSALLLHLLDIPGTDRSVVFTKTKHGAEKLAKQLSKNGVDAGAIHGNKTQSQRQRALNAFRDGRFSVLVATDVAARGLDVDGITHVFNFNLPMEAEAYVHRIGRTGRAGMAGQAVSFCSRDERGLLKAIQRLTGDDIDVSDIPASLEIPAEDSSAPRSRPAHKKSPTRKPSRGRTSSQARSADQETEKPKRTQSVRRKKKSNASNRYAPSESSSQPSNGGAHRARKRKQNGSVKGAQASGGRTRGRRASQARN